MMSGAWDKMSVAAKVALAAGAAAVTVATGAAMGQPASGPGSVVPTVTAAPSPGALPDFCYPAHGDPLRYVPPAQQPAALAAFHVALADDPCNPSPTLLSGGVNCDCPHVGFGILTKEFQDACFQHQTALRQEALDHKLGLMADPNHKLVSGDFCGDAGPAAWPEMGSPDVAPPAAPGSDNPPCKHVSGLDRTCLDVYAVPKVAPDSA